MLYKIYFKDGSVKTVIGDLDDVRKVLKSRPDSPTMILDIFNEEVHID